MAKITICDVCKKQSGENELVMITRFEAHEDWLGRPKLKKEVCQTCLDRIFPLINQSKNK